MVISPGGGSDSDHAIPRDPQDRAWSHCSALGFLQEAKYGWDDQMLHLRLVKGLLGDSF